MKPLRLSIQVEAVDHFVYKGQIFIVLADGGIKAVKLNDIFNALKKKYKDFEEISGILDISFRRNLHWRSHPVENILSIPEVYQALISAWNRVSENYFFEIGLDEVKSNVIVKEVPSELLDINVYGNKIFLGCLDGFYAIDLDKPHKKRSRKKFDGKTFHLSSGYSSVILSLGKDGLSHFDPFAESSIKDDDIKDEVSLLTSWTPAGSLMNYPDFSNPYFIGNEIQQNRDENNRVEDRYQISQFVVFKKELEKFIKNREIESFFAFNGKDHQYILDRDNRLAKGELKVRNQKLQSFNLENQDEQLDLKSYGQPISGHEVSKFPVIEFVDDVCLIQDGKVYELENESALSVHTYPKSTHFRDLVSVTTENFISLHSLDILSHPDASLHPEPHRWNHPVLTFNGIDDFIPPKSSVESFEMESDLELPL